MQQAKQKAAKKQYEKPQVFSDEAFEVEAGVECTAFDTACQTPSLA